MACGWVITLKFLEHHQCLMCALSIYYIIMTKYQGHHCHKQMSYFRLTSCAGVDNAEWNSSVDEAFYSYNYMTEPNAIEKVSQILLKRFYIILTSSIDILALFYLYLSSPFSLNIYKKMVMTC